jgi:hypothetical protein
VPFYVALIEGTGIKQKQPGSVLLLKYTAFWLLWDWLKAWRILGGN